MGELPQPVKVVGVHVGAGGKSRSRFFGPLTFSLAFKWTFMLAIFLALGMGLLGTFLIAEQIAAFGRQTSRAGGMLANQLARASAEPLLADDRFALELLVRRQLDDQLVVGAAVFDVQGWPQAVAGIKPEVDDELSLLLKNTAGRDWLLHEPDARRPAGVDRFDVPEGATWSTISWAETWEQTQQVAAALIDLGVEVGDPVAIMANNRTAHTLADYGSMAAAAIPMSIYNTLAQDQVAFIAAESARSWWCSRTTTATSAGRRRSPRSTRSATW